MTSPPSDTAASSAQAVTTLRHRPRRSRWVRWWPRTVPHVILIPIALIWIYPFLWMVSGSFKPLSEMITGGASLIPKSPTLHNYARAWSVGNFGQYLLNSVIVTIGMVFLVLAVSSLAGYALGRGHLPGKRIIVALVVATMFLPHGYTIIPVFLIINAMHLNNTLAGVILAEAGPAHIIAILLFMGFFAAIPQELEEAATIDGASHPRIFLHIMLPMAKPAIGTVALFNCMAAWNAFLIPLVFTLSKPELRTVGVGIYAFFGRYSTDFAALAAAAVISIAPIVLLFLWLQRMFVEGFAGAVKS